MGSIRKPLLAAGLALTVVAFPALAQQAVTYPQACDASKVSKGDVDRAHTVFLSGKQYLDESNYDKAISYFVDAYSIDCSVHAILPIIATAYERKGDKPEAVRALEEYVRRAPTAPDREKIERRIKNLNDQIAHEQPTPSATPTASAPPSSSAAAPPPPTASAAPESSAAAMTPAPPPETSHGRLNVGPIVLTAVGAAAAITGVVVYVVGAGKVSSAESACNNGRANCTPSVADDGNSGRSTEKVGAYVGFPGLAVAAAGVVWWALAGTSSSSASAPMTPKTPRTMIGGPIVTPVVAPGYAGLSLSTPL